MGVRWNPLGWLANGLGTGLIPWAPGTFGSLLGVVLYLLMNGLALWLYLLVTLLAFVAGIGICSHAARKLGEHDHPSIVWDEIVGVLITLIAVPAQWLWIGTGFVLFRIFDIWKPWPVRVADRRVKGGLGIMLDDVLAAGYALVVLHLIIAVVERS